MIVQFSVDSLLAKLITALITLGVFAILIFAAIWYLIVGTLSDDRITISRDVMQAGVEYFPNSPRLHARVAEIEMRAIDRDLPRAESHIRRAIELLPEEYTYRMLLGDILEAQGNRAEAESSYREALRLAPNYLEVHWRLANNLVRQGKVNESLPHFRHATSRNLSLLPNAYDLIWNVSNGNLEAVTSITHDVPKAQLVLAEFLVRQSRFTEAASIYRRVERSDRQDAPESAAIITALIAANQLPLARELWGEMVSEEVGKPQPLIWNGSFETAIAPAFSQFDWALKDNDYARVAIDPQTARNGTQALRVAFLGKDTARIDGEIKQLLLVKPGKRYRLEAHYKIRGLITPMGPRVAITDQSSQTVIAASDPLPEGTHAWQQLSFEFTAPANASAVWLQIQRIPKYSYDDPTRGSVWFDDFVLKEQ
jgi:tetratricopeptide (TPR) repeat protein